MNDLISFVDDMCLFVVHLDVGLADLKSIQSLMLNVIWSSKGPASTDKTSKTTSTNKHISSTKLSTICTPYRTIRISLKKNEAHALTNPKNMVLN